MELPVLIALLEVYRTRIILEELAAPPHQAALSVIVPPISPHRFLPRAVIMEKVHRLLIAI